jgi:transposase
MRFVPVKSAERQSVLVVHRSRELLVRQRTMLINAVRGQGAEFGLIAPQGALHVAELIVQIRSADSERLPFGEVSVDAAGGTARRPDGSD